MEKKALVFDLDGTLWNAAPASTRSWNQVLAKWGFGPALSVEQMQGISGLPFEDCVRALIPQSQSLSVSEQKHFLHELEEAEHHEIKARGGEIFAGAAEALMELTDHPLYLVSNCTDWYLDAFLKHWRGPKFIDAAFCGKYSENKRGNLEFLKKRDGLKAPLYIGDTGWDQRAAYGAGYSFLFVDFGFGKPLVSCPRAKDWAELMQFVRLSSPQDFQVQVLPQDHHAQAQAFYASVGYKILILKSDVVVVATTGEGAKKEIVGTCRLSSDAGTVVLRGVQIHPQWQRSGLGLKMIQLLEKQIPQATAVWCLPHDWLSGFYQKIGFHEVQDPSLAPAFLRERLQQTKEKYPWIILMKRE